MRSQPCCTLTGTMVLAATVATLVFAAPGKVSAQGKDKEAGSGSRETSSPYRPPKETARMSREYIEKTLKIQVA